MYLAQVMDLCTDFDGKIQDDIEEALRTLMIGQLIEKFEDTDSLCILFELIF